jgi:hypothetical protein
MSRLSSTAKRSFQNEEKTIHVILGDRQTWEPASEPHLYVMAEVAADAPV